MKISFQKAPSHLGESNTFNLKANTLIDQSPIPPPPALPPPPFTPGTLSQEGSWAVVIEKKEFPGSSQRELSGIQNEGPVQGRRQR